MPDSLLEKGSPEVSLHFIDGKRLAAQLKTLKKQSSLSVELGGTNKADIQNVKISRDSTALQNYETCLSVNLSKLAKLLSKTTK